MSESISQTLMIAVACFILMGVLFLTQNSVIPGAKGVIDATFGAQDISAMGTKLGTPTP